MYFHQIHGVTRLPNRPSIWVFVGSRANLALTYQQKQWNSKRPCVEKKCMSLGSQTSPAERQPGSQTSANTSVTFVAIRANPSAQRHSKLSIQGMELVLPNR